MDLPHRRRTRSGRPAALASATLLACSALPAAAQTAAAPTIDLPTVRVQGQVTGHVDGYVATTSATGTKTDTPLIETPQSVSVITQDQIIQQDARTIGQTLDYTVGVQGNSRVNLAGGTDSILYARGFALSRYLNGLQLQGGSGFITPTIDPYLLERVEVLRGPSSVLYGAGSPGGLVNITSKLPTAAPVGEVFFEGGTRNSFEGGVDVGGPLGSSGAFSYRLTAVGRTADNQVDFNSRQRVSIAPALTWKPDADTSVTLLLNYQDDPHVGLYNFVPSRGSVLPNLNGSIGTRFFAGDPDTNRYSQQQFSAGYLAERRLSDVFTVRQSLRYLQVNGRVTQLLPAGLAEDDATLSRYAVDDKEQVGTFSIDTQAQANFRTGPIRHTALLGVDYQQTHFNETFDFGSDVPELNVFAPTYNVAVGPLDRVQNTKQFTDQVGLYLQDQIRFGKLAFLFSGRHDWAHSRTTDNLLLSSTEQDDRKFTGRAGVVYLFDSGFAPYASYATSFQPTIGVDAGGGAFKPTTGQQYDIGLKYQPPGLNSFAMVSLFELTQQNALTVDVNNPLFQVQTGEIRSRGVEVSAALNLLPGLNVLAAYSYNDPIVTKSGGDDLGKVPVFVPRNTASLWVDYRFQDTRLRGLQLAGGVRYNGYTFGDNANTLKVPSYTLFDARVGYDLSNLTNQLQGWNLAVNARNLFDKKYVSECSGDNCLYGLRRTVFASIRKTF